MAALTWEICDLNQVVLGRLDNRDPGAKVMIPLNGGRRASVSLDASDPVLAAVASAAGVPVLNRVLRARIIGQDPIFCGRIFVPQLAAGGGSGTVTLNALDPWAMLDRDFIADTVGTQLRYHQFGPVDQSTLAKQICDYGGVEHGIYTPTSSLAAASVTRTRTYPVGQSLGRALTELADLDLGPDVDLLPIIDAGNPTKLAQLYTYYPKRGTDKSASVVFEYGHGRQSALSYSLDPTGERACNYFLAIGSASALGADYRIAALAQHAGSLATYGRLGDFEERTDTTDYATLRDYAKAQVGQRHDPTAFFAFTQAPQDLAIPPNITSVRKGAPPSFGPLADYYLGDTIALRVQPDGTNDPEFQQTYVGRVTDAELTELENGQIQVRVDCSPEIDTSGVAVTKFNAYLPDLSTV